MESVVTSVATCLIAGTVPEPALPGSGGALEAPDAPHLEGAIPDTTDPIIHASVLGADLPSGKSVFVSETGRSPDADRRERDARRKRQSRHRRKVLEGLWRPHGIGPCRPPCPWAVAGVPCECSEHPDLPCSCARRMWKKVEEESSALGVGAILSGLIASIIVDVVRLQAEGDDRKALAAKLQLLNLLSRDTRSAQALWLQERRLNQAQGDPAALFEATVARLADGNGNGGTSR
jgi:hypothetical protein